MHAAEQDRPDIAAASHLGAPTPRRARFQSPVAYQRAIAARSYVSRARSVGFVHTFRPLRAEEVRQLLTAHYRQMSLALPVGGITDPESVAAIIRITAGNFRLIHRLLSQVERILRVNALSAVTPAVVDAAREGLVIGAV